MRIKITALIDKCRHFYPRMGIQQSGIDLDHFGALIGPTPAFNTRFIGGLPPSFIPGQAHTEDSRRETRLPSIPDIQRSAGRSSHANLNHIKELPQF